MINEDKILAFLNDDLKCALVEKKQETLIVVTSPVSAANLVRLIEFCVPLHYTVRFDGVYIKGLIISPTN